MFTIHVTLPGRRDCHPVVPVIPDNAHGWFQLRNCGEMLVLQHRSHDSDAELHAQSNSCMDTPPVRVRYFVDLTTGSADNIGLAFPPLTVADIENHFERSENGWKTFLHYNRDRQPDYWLFVRHGAWNELRAILEDRRYYIDPRPIGHNRRVVNRFVGR